MTPDDLKPGLRHSQTITVDASLTVPRVSAAFTGFADMPPVFATAFLVGFVEWTCIELLRPYLAPHQRTVGTCVDLSHVAATPIGLAVTAQAELVEIEGRKLCFHARCHDVRESIGEGHHERAIIDYDKFIARIGLKTST
ncbi:thioesterase [Oleomonas cavernae]|uniref:Thioesterase n=1 Tax=Oleomonas cavernae TaxID=2320859 RepID=A0A418WI95_9PROT|nr:thioesterase family protein [Oleomonas cavernae]RJF89776.1 thioesterase [Oleomonas cavernae]